MRDNSYDRTIERNYLQKWRFLIPEYEAVKAGRSEAFKRVGDFYRHHGTCSQTFRKYYNRYLQSGSETDLLPSRFTGAPDERPTAGSRSCVPQHHLPSPLAEK
jgi:hypothetical protein